MTGKSVRHHFYRWNVEGIIPIFVASTKVSDDKTLQKSASLYKYGVILGHLIRRHLDHVKGKSLTMQNFTRFCNITMPVWKTSHEKFVLDNMSNFRKDMNEKSIPSLYQSCMYLTSGSMMLRSYAVKAIEISCVIILVFLEPCIEYLEKNSRHDMV